MTNPKTSTAPRAAGDGRGSRIGFPTRLLIDLPNWVGDTMMALPATAVLINANRAGSTVIHARPSMKRFLEALFPDARLITTVKKTLPFATARSLHRDNIDLGITFRNAFRAKILLFLAARIRLGSQGQGARLLLTQAFPTDRSQHQIFDSDPLLRALGLDPVQRAQCLDFPQSLIVEGRESMRARGLGNRPIIGLAPASASAGAKRWSADKFGRLAASFIALGIEPVILIGPGEETLALDIVKAAGTELPILGHDLDVAGLAALCTQTAAVVGVDSGPTHVAALAGTGVVALFGPTDACRTSPNGAHTRVLSSGLECSPCGESFCPQRHHDCMGLLSVDCVLEAVLTMINLPKMRSEAAASR